MCFPFLSLPGEIRNHIYTLLTMDGESNKTLSRSESRDGSYEALTRTCQQLRSEYLPVHMRTQSRWTTSIALEDVNAYIEAFFGRDKHFRALPRKLCVMLKSLDLVTPQNSSPVDLIPLLLYLEYFPGLVLVFVADRRGSKRPLTGEEDEESYGLNITLSSRTRIARDVTKGKITSATYKRDQDIGGEIRIDFKPELAEVCTGEVWRTMAAWRKRKMESRYYQSLPLGKFRGGWLQFDVDVNLDLDGITPSQWAAKAASDRAVRAKKHNVYFLRCINP